MPRESSHQYWAPPRWVAYALQKPVQEELDRLQKWQIIVPLNIDETSEWCYSFVLVQKEMVRLGYAWIWHG